MIILCTYIISQLLSGARTPTVVFQPNDQSFSRPRHPSTHSGGLAAKGGQLGIPMGIHLEKSMGKYGIYPLVISCIAHGKSPFSIGKPSISMDHLYHGYVKYVSHNQRVPRIHPEITLKKSMGKILGLMGDLPRKNMTNTTLHQRTGGSSDAKSSWLGTRVLVGQPSCRTY